MYWPSCTAAPRTCLPSLTQVGFGALLLQNPDSATQPDFQRRNLVFKKHLENACGFVLLLCGFFGRFLSGFQEATPGSSTENQAFED